VRLILIGNHRPRWSDWTGTPFADVDDTWTCPDCGVREQVDFIPIEEFVHNDQDGNIISAETRTRPAEQQ